MQDQGHAALLQPASSEAGEESRRVILDAAARSFMERGYTETSIDDVARRLKSTKGRIYHHFASKAELFAAIFKAGMDKDYAAIADACALNAPPLVRLRAMMTAHCRQIILSRPYQRVVWQGVTMLLRGATTPELREELLRLMAYRDAYERLFRDEIAKLGAENVGLSATMMFVALNSPIFWYSPRDGETEADIENLVGQVVGFALGGLGLAGEAPHQIPPPLTPPRKGEGGVTADARGGVSGRAAHGRDIFEFVGNPAVCDPSGALFFAGLGLLVVSDLHLEKGSAYARRGALLPPYDTAATLAALQVAAERYQPRTVISLGDSFHDGWGAERLPEHFRAALLSMMRGRDWFWVAGNHDPAAPKDLPGETVADIAVAGMIFRHEPSPGAAPGEVAGHLHPGARIVQRGRSVRKRCFASDGTRLIMPAFGAYTGSLNILDEAYRGLFNLERLVAYMIGDSRVYPIAGKLLRPA